MQRYRGVHANTMWGNADTVAPEAQRRYDAVQPFDRGWGSVLLTRTSCQAADGSCSAHTLACNWPSLELPPATGVPGSKRVCRGGVRLFTTAAATRSTADESRTQGQHSGSRGVSDSRAERLHPLWRSAIRLQARSVPEALDDD